MLAVFTSQLGASFINRHALDVMPGQTVVVSKRKMLSPGGYWNASIPAFYVDEWMQRLSVRLARRAGLSVERQFSAALERFLRRHRVAVVLGEFLDEFVEFVPMLDRMGIPYVVQSHGMDASAKLRDPRIVKSYLAYNSARAVLTRNELHRRRLIELGLPASKVHVSIGGIDVPDTPPRRGPQAIRRFLAIGYMTPKKSPIYLLEAFRRAAAEDPEITLDYVGGGPLYPAAQHFVAACAQAGRVRLHGLASEETKHRLLGECGVFVQHSITDPDTGDEEGLPASIQEAMAQGMAIVGTRHSGIPEVVEEGKTGLLVEEGDVNGMARAMLQVVRSASAMGEAAYRDAAAKHDWHFEKERLLRALGLPDGAAH